MHSSYLSKISNLTPPFVICERRRECSEIDATIKGTRVLLVTAYQREIEICRLFSVQRSVDNILDLLLVFLPDKFFDKGVAHNFFGGIPSQTHCALVPDIDTLTVPEM